MNKKFKYVLWFLFLLVIPVLYISFKIIFPNAVNIEFIITIGSYLIAILSFMYRIDMKLYFIIQRLILPFKYSFTSWVLSARYNTITSETSLNEIEKSLTSIGARILKREKSFLNVLWNSRNIISIRIEEFGDNEISIHLYTSKIDVPIKENSKNIRSLCGLLEKIENILIMNDRNDKTYEMDIEYSNKSPFYNYWIKSLPEEKIYQFNCKIKVDDDIGLIDVNKNHIYIQSERFSDLFHKLDYYLTLRSN